MSNLHIGDVVAFQTADDMSVNVGVVESIWQTTGQSLVVWYSEEDLAWYHAYVERREWFTLDKKSVAMAGHIL